MNRQRQCFITVVIALLLGSAAGAGAQTTANVPRPEHPRPDFMREPWQTLNGAWQFDFDDQNRGLAERWYAPQKKLSKTIQVPYAFQTRLSGIADTSFHDVIWYRRQIEIPLAWSAQHVLLHFGAVDYEAMVWVNGQLAATHRGGNTPFSIDVTDLVRGVTPTTVVVRAWDPSTDRSIPRGKQFWEPQPRSIWYTRTSGIWQPVWIEAVPVVHISALRVTPEVDRSQVTIEARLSAQPTAGAGAGAVKLHIIAKPQEEGDAAETIVSMDAATMRGTATITLRRQRLWSPEHPNLYDLAVELLDANGQVIDHVNSYFGQRKVHTQGDRVFLNNSPYYLRLVLDQGYWPESTLTPPSDEAMQYDIKMTKAFGFNGVRKHQKVEDPRWLYFADRMGLIVWGEMANAQEYTEEYVTRFVGEWEEVVQRDYSHPSIIAWVPINESWGVPNVMVNDAQQKHLASLYYLTHSLDQTRPVVDNDGWEHTEATDLFTLHDYARTGAELTTKYAVLATVATPATVATMPPQERQRIPRNAREAVVNGARYNGTPILMTEFGGVAYRPTTTKAGTGSEKDWGYSGIEPTADAMLSRIDGLVKALRANSVIGGFCYTQLTDVEQEINGLMTYDRKPKVDPAAFQKIFAQ
jgi:beta-galactosidase/beta-glucuronidase